MNGINEQILSELESQERYEDCRELVDKHKAIESGDHLRYTELAFDLEGLTESGFVKPGTDTQGLHDRVVKYFGYKSIFEYEGGITPAINRRNLKILQTP